MKGILETLGEVVSKLDSLGIDYFLVGSLATMYYGRPRFTRDIDLVLRIRAKDIGKFVGLFPIEEFYCPPKEVVHDEVLRKGSFNLISQDSGVKIDIVIDKETDFYQSEFQRRKKIEMAPGLEVFIASPEDLILKKLDFYREGKSEKHLLDIKDILASVEIDEDYMNGWVEAMNLDAEWKAVF